MSSALNSYLRCLAIVAALFVSACSPTGGMRTSATVDGMVADFGVIPAALIAGREPGTEPTMHGRSEAMALGAHHLLVALFDTTTGRRITDAIVDAVVTPHSGVGIKRRLEPMMIADVQAYGNYFPMQATGSYEIAVAIRRPGTSRDAVVHFRYHHLPDHSFGF